MIEVQSCVICDGKIVRLKRALVAPFLAKRIWNRNVFCVDLVQCKGCKFMFYNPRLEEAELERLYSEYRLDAYQVERNSFEPWYSRKMNADLASPRSYAERRTRLSQILKPHLGGRRIRRVLDYGGDRGELASCLIDGVQAYVYEISRVEPVAGVIAVEDPASCTADLILNSNVLEHVGFPKATLSQIVRAAPAGGLILIEVPCEMALGAYRLSRRAAQIGLTLLLRPKVGLRMLGIPALYMMHEHINYFSEQSLLAVVRECEATVIASGVYRLAGTPGRADMAWCLGERKRENER